MHHSSSCGAPTDLGFTRDRQFKLRKSATVDLRGRVSKDGPQAKMSITTFFGRDDEQSNEPYSYASNRFSTIEALVPPKPKELERTQPSSTLSRRSRTIGISAISGSSVSILALSQTKPLCIIN